MRNMVRKSYFIAAMILLVITLGLFFQFHYLTSTWSKKTQLLAEESTNTVGSKVSSSLMDKAQLINVVSEYISLDNMDNNLLPYMKVLLEKNKDFSSIYFCSTDNKMINASGWIPPKGFDLRTRPWYKKATQQNKLIFTEAFVNATKDKLIVTIAKPVYNGKKQLLGVIAGDVSVQNILSMVRDKKILGKGYSFLIDGNNNILANPKLEYNLDSALKNIDDLSSDIDQYLSQSKPGITRLTLDDTDGYLAYQPIENTDWKIACFIPVKEFSTTDKSMVMVFAVGMLSSFALMLMFLLHQRKYIIKPMVALDDDIQRINLEKDIGYRLPVPYKDIFTAPRRSLNAFLSKIQSLLEQIEMEEEELRSTNDELEATVQQLSAAEEELRIQYDQLTESEYTFRTLFEGSADPILILDEATIVDCNPAAVEFMEYAAKDDLIGKTVWEISPETQPNGKHSEVDALEKIERAREVKKLKFDWLHKKCSNKPVNVEVMLTAIMLDGKQVLHVLLRDISQRKQMEQKLEYLSYHDQLTGLYNRRFFEEELHRLDVQRNLPLTIMMADVNGLKLINDSFGHAIGDELLKKVTQVMKKGFRSDDIIARLGGDEFVILLPNIDTHAAEQIVKRLRHLSTNESVEAIDISISFGWETKTRSDENINDVLKKAEDYMYKRKLFESPSMRGKTISAIISTLHEKNKREEAHSHRVSTLCRSMGKAMNMTDGEIQELKSVGLLHDIGKIAIEENILNKPSKLSDNEWEEIKRHPEIGYRILSTVNDMSELSEYVLAHHERWDGTGYPKGLKGDNIPLQSRIISIVDTYDAITSERSYRKALPEEVALDELRKNAGTQFDPHLVSVFIEKVLGKTS